LSVEEHEHLFRRTRLIKERFKNYIAYQPLVDRMLAMVFEKSSTRTRVSFEAGIHQLGGSSIVLNMSDTQFGRGEPIEDISRIVTRMVDIVMIRTFEQSIIERFAAHSRVPVERCKGVDAKHLEQFGDPLKAVEGAHLVTTDVWTSMGFEAESEARRKAFSAFTVDERMMAAARPEALFMHCLPAH